MKHRFIVVASSVVLLVMAIFTVIRAPHSAADENQRLIGSWFGTATATSVPLPPLQDLITFMSDGGVVESRRLFLANSPLGPLMGTPGHGTWAKVGSAQFAVTLVIIYEGAEGHPTASGQVVAIEKVRFDLEVGPEPNKLSGTLVDEIRDTDGNLIFVGPGTYVAERILTEPAP